MTMRLDIVTNDAGELVRREHARELGGGVVVAIYRLAKLAQMHDLGNQAFLRQLDQTYQMIGEYCLRSGGNVNVLFADKATFVAGQLLKGNRGAYEAAAELGALLERIGGSELNIARDVTREDLQAFAEQLSLFHRNNAAQLRLPPKIHLRRVADAARLRGIELEDLTPDQRIVRAYASAVVIMRRFYEDLSASRYVLPRRIKRIAQSLVDLSDARATSFLGVTEVRNANHDEAGRAVNTAILAVAIARESTQDRTTLAQIAMAAMMHDVARPRALAIAGADGSPLDGMAGPSTLSEDQEDRLAAGAAAVLTALGRVNEPSITRTVVTFEALWLRRKTWLGPVYWGARAPTLHASIIAVARRYNDLLTPEPGLPPPTTDYAVAMLAEELTEPQDRTVLRMLVSALGLLPIGTVVLLSTREVAEVVRGSKGIGDKPRVKLVTRADGAPYPQETEIELAEDPARTVVRVLGVDGWRKGLAAGPPRHEDLPDELLDYEDDVAPPPLLEELPVEDAPSGADVRSGVGDRQRDEPVALAQREHPAFTDAASGISGEHSGTSMPSLGSTPSSVAEAMGRMIEGSLDAETPQEADRVDRTVFQPQAPGDAPLPRPASKPVREATARGNLDTTPLPHVLVYMLDHALTGSVVFEGPKGRDGQDDTIYFVSGVPAKIRLRESVALLGDVLAREGLLQHDAVDQAVDGARRLGILLGEYLVGHDLVGREALAWGLQAQLLQKVAHVANLAPDIEYAYFRDVDLLDSWGGDVLVSHPVNPILASVRHWRDRARVRATLNRIGNHQLALHPEADLSNLALTEEEQVVLDALRDRGVPLEALFEQKLADEATVSSLVYTLAVTRQFTFLGQKKPPMASRATRRALGPTGSGAAIHRPPPVKPAVPAPPPTSIDAGPPANTPAARTVAGAPIPVGSPARPASPASPASSATKAPAPPSRPSTLGVVRPGAPQIRPISVKKPAQVGLQPAKPAPQGAPTASRPADIPANPAPKPLGAAGDLLPKMIVASPSLVEKPAGKATGAAWGPSKVQTTVRGVAPAPAYEDADVSFRHAEEALARNDLAAAEEHAKRAVERDPMQPAHVILLAWVRALGGAPRAPEDAIRTLSKLLIEDPSNEKALFYRAKILVRTNRLPEALNDFNELIAANPDHREAQLEVDQLKAKLQSTD
ncbi:MAG TPA: hypothetical protein VM925_31980 [Labilithrix sp.]|nr:hypothetical protein [Labilithrix sp.]